MDGGFLSWIPTQQEERVGFVVRRNKISRVRLVLVEEGIFLPVAGRKVGSSVFQSRVAVGW